MPVLTRAGLIGAVKAAGATPTADTTKLTYPSLKTQADILAFAQSVEQQAPPYREFVS